MVKHCVVKDELQYMLPRSGVEESGSQTGLAR